MNMYLQAVIIFFARITDMSFCTIRTIASVKGQRELAAFLGFFEVLIYTLVLGNVVDNLDNPILLLSYCFGFAFGTIVGGKVESILSLGRVCAQIFLKNDHAEMIDDLRKAGFGVTVFEGQGWDGKSYMLNIIAERKSLDKLHNVVEKYDKNTFVTIMDIRTAYGGHFGKNMTVSR